MSYGFGKALPFSRCYLGYLAIHWELRTRLFQKRNPLMKKLIAAMIAAAATMSAAHAQQGP